ncbi:MAG: GNAT family N-acetyltransferase [Nocardioides sp.]
MTTDDLTWGELDGADVPALADLARACLAADGGLPLLAEPGLLQVRLLGGRTLAARTADGAVVAAAGVRVDTDGATTSGLVHPDRRGRGLGRRLMEWAADEARGVPLTVATETCSAGAERLYARYGLSELFSELVMRHPLTDLPTVSEPDGVEVRAVADASPEERFAAYVGSFRDRPGFPDPRQEEWLEELDEDEEFRRDLSLVAFDDTGGAVGFVNILGPWVDQVGVVPTWRGRGLGAYLVARSLAALAAEGAAESWLCVNVDNPAARLYEGLGFEVHGRRARFAVAG